jgi:hypothetical protein
MLWFKEYGDVFFFCQENMVLSVMLMLTHATKRKGILHQKKVQNWMLFETCFLHLTE